MTEVIYSISSKIIENTSTICVIAGGAAVLYFCNKMFINYMIKSKDNEILELNNTITEQQQKINNLNNSVDNLNNTINELSNTNIISSNNESTLSIDNIGEIIDSIDAFHIGIGNVRMTGTFNYEEMIGHLKACEVDEYKIYDICVYINDNYGDIFKLKSITMYHILQSNIISEEELAIDMSRVFDFLSNSFIKPYTRSFDRPLNGMESSDNVGRLVQEKLDVLGKPLNVENVLNEVADFFMSKLDEVVEYININSLPNFTILLFLIYSLFFIGIVIINRILESRVLGKYLNTKNNTHKYLYSYLRALIGFFAGIGISELTPFL